MNQEHQSSTLKIAGGVIAFGLVVALIIWIATNDSMQQTALDDGSTQETELQQEQHDDHGEETASSGEYENGEYTAMGVYTSPAGREEVEISLTVEDGVVTSAGFDGKAVNPTSVLLQARFEEGFEAEVVGRSLDEISLTVVNGSSLTPRGFMEALERIKEEAEV